MESLGRFLLILGAIVGAMQFIPSYEISNPPTDPRLEIDLPADLKEILKRSCYDCHSNGTRWPWYAYVAPMKWVVRRDVIEGRKALNFSVWKAYPQEKRQELKRKIFRSVALAMPLPQYLWLNPEGELTQEEREKIRLWASDGKGYLDVSVR